MQKNGVKIVIRLVLLAALIALLYASRELPLADWLAELAGWASDNPVAGALTFIVLTILATVALLPGWIAMMLGGLIFGLHLGLVYTMLGITGGAVAGFLVGRTLARNWVERRIAGNEMLLALDDVLDEQAFKIVALTRVALIFPFNLLNYAYGVTRVHLPAYALGTAVGMLPIVGLYVYLGTLAQDLSQILAEGADLGAGVWWAVGIATVAIVSVVSTVRKALNRSLQLRAQETEQA
jgi:uncharacterized membrane protein YdjX (TVP38/TMEM64 family)